MVTKCGFAERISLLIDGELTADESVQAREHLAGCQTCQKLQEEFLFLRQEIKEFVPRKLQLKEPEIEVFPPKKARIWSRKISLPVPVFAAFVLILALLSGWNFLFNDSYDEGSTIVRMPVEKSDVEENRGSKEKNEMTLAHFDRGERAEIFIARREALPGDK